MNCYLCHSVNFFERPGSVRDNSDLNILECQNCGLVQLSSQEHLKAGHYENSRMHGPDPEPMEVWERNTAEDDQRRFEMLQAFLPNKRVLDFGCGNGGFLSRVSDLAQKATGVELEKRVQEYWQGRIEIYPSLSNLEGGTHLRPHYLFPCNRASSRSSSNFTRFQEVFILILAHCD